MAKATTTLSPWQILKFFWGYYMQKKRLFWPLFVLRILVPIVSLLPAAYYKELIDLISNFTGQDKMSLISALMSIVLIIAGIKFLQVVLYRLSDFFLIKMSTEIMQTIYQDSFSYLQGHSYQFFVNNFTGSLIRKVWKLVGAYDNMTDVFVFSISSMIVSSLFIIIASGLENFYYGLVFFLWIVAFVIVQYLLYKRNYPYEIKVNKADSELSGTLSDAITNYFNIKIFSSVRREVSAFSEKTRIWANLAKTRYYRSMVIWGSTGLLMVVCEILMLYLTIKFWGIGLISLGVFVLLQMYMVKLFDLFWNLGYIFRALFRGFWDAGEMIEILQTPHEIQDKSDKKLKVKQGEIRFQGVDFSYGEHQIFQDLNLHIKPGQRVALVGQSGSGKTTITKLLFRFYDIQKGKILIDDQDISQVTQESLRSYLSLVPQDPILFHRSIRENIAYARPDASDDEIKAAARMARCDLFIDHLEDKYETLVGERGIKLSWGERQRIAIARAIIENAPILIMDEATSALDSESEKYIQEAMVEVMKNKTSIVIAHRLSTIMKMDRIIVMDQWKIVESWTHSELIQKPDGIYKKLRDIQSGGFIK